MAIYLPEGIIFDTQTNRAAIRDAAALNECIESGRIVESKALVCNGDHDLIVDLNGIKGVIPRNEGAVGISEGVTRDIAIISRVNKPVCFTVQRLLRDKNGNLTAMLSRRQAQQQCADNYLSKLRPGDVIKVKVTHLENFGCFVDIGCGIASLIPIDSISVSRISHPRDRFKVGQEILAVVKTIEDGKINLSHKELLGTWEQNASLFTAGETVAGIIRSIEEYGIFVELTPNLAGLAELRDDVTVGQHAGVYIKSLIPEKMKVKLIIIESFESDDVNYNYNYHITGGKLDHWRYSPDSSSKLIETVF